MSTPRAEDWRRCGGRFSWRPAGEDAASVEIDAVEIDAASDQGPGALEAELGAPLLVDSSRERLPGAADLLRAEAPAGAG